MPCCTFLSESEVSSWRDQISDKQIVELLDEVNEVPGNRFAVQPKTFYQRSWLGKRTSTTVYYLYWYVLYNDFIESNEWQCINFPGDGLCFAVDARAIKAFLLGYIDGMSFIKGKQQ